MLLFPQVAANGGPDQCHSVSVLISGVKTNLISRAGAGARGSAPIRLDTNTANFCQMQGYMEAVTGFKVKLRSK